MLSFTILFLNMYIVSKSGETRNEVKIVEYLWAFLVGGALCAVGQLLIDFTKLTPARILVTFVTLGVVLTGLGLYEPLVQFAGAGATVPLTGFGYTMAKGTLEAIREKGLIGVFSGGVAASAAGIAAAVFFGYVAALFSKPGDKN
ncbi:SpoVA protein [Caproiciproducens galactitolivorans]|uniref:SpoVA protein n=1 Tax=Caproiciproducens galactitolivorans TaxID=642589 RepID=A0A4Z0YC56_9FIRM|nr:SpoVA protein [Caproiciproducens galactitolivorans]